MNKNLSMFIIRQKIELSEAFNGIIWAFRHIPFIGKYFGDKYKFESPKQVIHSLYPIFTLIKGLIKSLLSFGIVAIFVGVILGWAYGIFKPTYERALYWDKAYSMLIPLYLYWLMALLKDLVGADITDLKKYYQNFRFSPEEIIKSKLYFAPLVRFFTRSIVLMVALYLIAKVNPLLSLGFSLAIYFTEIAASAFWLEIDLRFGKSIFTNGLLQLIVMVLVFFLMTYLMLFKGLSDKIFLGLVFISSGLGFLMAINYFRKFNKYGFIIEKSLREYDDIMEEIDASPAASVKLKDKDIDNKKVKGEGFAYLNNIFFRRHRRILLKPVLIKSGILAALLTILISFLPFFEKNIDGDLVEMLVILVPLATYILCKQDNILTAFFINCDQGLIPYGFYRQPTNLLTMYRARLVSLLKINAIPAIVYVFGLVGVFLRLHRTDYIFALEAIAYILLAGVFFTSLPLAQYYLFQPFNAEGAKVGKISGAIDMVVYIFCFNAIRFTGGIKTPILVIGSSIFILLFTIITSLLIFKIGPKTFRLKN